MSTLENEIKELKDSTVEMWSLVINQMDKVKTAFIEFDKNLASEVMAKEKRVDAYELKIDKECEVFALKNPFATDLRFVLAILKINTNLERIGDYADSIARIVDDMEEPPEEEFLKRLRILEMFHICFSMLGEGLNSMILEDSKLARKLFRMDKELNTINRSAPRIVCDLIKDYPDKSFELIEMLLIVSKLERVGDQLTNIAEEIVYFIEAKKLMHSSLKNKLKSD